MPNIFDRLSLFFPANRRLAEAWASAAEPSPVALAPFMPGPQSSPQSPPIAWGTIGQEPPPTTYKFTPGYSGHTYTPQTAPLGFEGWGLQSVRNAIALHRLGVFWESSRLMVALMGFAPVLAALQQAIAPIFDLDRYIRGGDKGLSRMVAEELEEALVPRSGLHPSPYLPPILWGTCMIYLRMMGFAVLQHVDGEPDPETQIRPRYTRLWPPWAVRYERTLGKWFAYTTEEVVEIKDDGKFTLIRDEEEPHFTGAIVAVSEEVLSGRLIQQLRNSWFFKYGNPKWVATLPEKVATLSDHGRAFFAALQTITGPDGVGALPFGSTFSTVGLDSKASNSFGEGLQSVILHIAMVLVGSAGTGIDGGELGGEVYKPQKGGYWSVRHDLIARPLKAIVRALNGGHIRPWLDINYGSEIPGAKRAGTWKDPILDIPLPKPDQEQRITAYGERVKLALEIVKAAHEDGVLVDQDYLDKLCGRLEIDPMALASARRGPPIEQWEIDAKLVAPDEFRADYGLAPLPNGAGSVERLAEERLAGKDKAGSKASLGDPDIDGKPPTVPDDAEPAGPPEGEGATVPAEEAA